MSTTALSKPCVVLVVEDDALLRLDAMDIVEDLGFRAIEARDADEAMAVLAREPSIDILFTDVDMPGTMDGLGLARDARLRRPSLGVLVLSGADQARREVLPSGGVFLAKPCPHAVVARTLVDLAATCH